MAVIWIIRYLIDVRSYNIPVFLCKETLGATWWISAKDPGNSVVTVFLTDELSGIFMGFSYYS